MNLMRVRRAAQLSLPAELQQALNVQEGDYLEAHIVPEGVLLKPASIVERKRAWKNIEATLAGVVDLETEPQADSRATEDAITEAVMSYRRERKNA